MSKSAAKDTSNPFKLNAAPLNLPPEPPSIPPESQVSSAPTPDTPAAPSIPPKPLEIWRSLETKSAMVNGSFQRFGQGQLITDPSVVKQLLQQGFPIISAASGARFYKCESCGHQQAIDS